MARSVERPAVQEGGRWSRGPGLAGAGDTLGASWPHPVPATVTGQAGSLAPTWRVGAVAWAFQSTAASRLWMGPWGWTR